MSWLIVVTFLSRVILFALILLSVWSVKIILQKRRELGAYLQSDADPELFDLIAKGDRASVVFWMEAHKGIRTDFLKMLVKNQQPLSTDHASSAFIKHQSQKLESGLAVLGTLGSTSPFIGLLGTILGIIVSFGELSLGNTDSLKVMYLLAEALILTAVGLGVAIPAVIAFNFYKKKISTVLMECDSIKDQYIAFILGK